MKDTSPLYTYDHHHYTVNLCFIAIDLTALIPPIARKVPPKIAAPNIMLTIIITIVTKDICPAPDCGLLSWDEADGKEA